MNSYPPEFLNHHVPLMLVSGLGTAPRPGPAGAPNGGDHPPTSAADVFPALAGQLKNILLARGRPVVWDSSRGTQPIFHTVLVENNVRLPPRKTKVAPSSGSEAAPPPNVPARSPLSPLHPTSPLYPDGIMAPIWLRKHRDMVPSVFTAFHTIWEPGQADGDSKENYAEVERRNDQALIADIAERKRSVADRGIKLTVVLLTSRRMLDNPNLEARLSFIRRSSGLDTKASLFVLTPVNQPELVEFVSSLQRTLYDHALDFYRDHSRRVRRKRNRPAPSSNARNRDAPPPLSARGWAVRSEYKLATFAEFRQELDVALKHYESCYSDLADMFGSTVLLPPRTKRWAEAKVLADCINLKICKFFMYQEEPQRALVQFNRHISRFRDLSNGWGIGDTTFEYWSWLSKQYRIFGDLVDLASRSGFRLPVHSPQLPPFMPSHAVAPGSSAMNFAAGPNFGITPLLTMQHAGFYYYLAAACAVERRDKFKKLVESQSATADDGPPTPTAGLPALMHEKKIDHTAQIIELYTRAYETFKRYKTNRMTLFVASHIALAYYESEQYEMALRFFERIARTYRRERWNDVLGSTLTLAAECAKQIDDVEAGVKSLFEIVSSASQEVPLSLRQRAETELAAILEEKSLPEEKGPVQINVTSLQIFDVSALFWYPSVESNQPAPFQVIISAPLGTCIGAISFSSLRLSFGDGLPSLVVKHEGADDSATFYKTDVGPFVLDEEDVSRPSPSADLRWPEGGVRIFSGNLFSAKPRELKIATITLIKEGPVPVEVELDCSFSDATRPLLGPKWYIGTTERLSLIRMRPRADPCKTVVRRHQHKLDVSFRHAHVAFLDERLPIEVEVRNGGDEDLRIHLDVFLQGVVEQSSDRLAASGHDAASVLKGLSLDMVPASSTAKATFYLIASGLAGQRSLDVFAHSQTLKDSKADKDDTAELAESEVLHTLSIPVEPLFNCAFVPTYRHLRKPFKALLDFEDSEEDDRFVADAAATLSTVLTCLGPTSVSLEGVALQAQPESQRMRLTISGNYASKDDFPLSLEAGDSFSALYSLEIGTSELESEAEDAKTPGAWLEISWRRSSGGGADSPLNVSRLAVPPLRPPLLSVHVTASLPPVAYLQDPFTLVLTLSNPSQALSADLRIHIESCEAFVFAGPRQLTVPVLLPGSQREVKLIMVPVAVGRVQLPRIRVWDRRATSAGAADGPDADLVEEPADPSVSDDPVVRAAAAEEKERAVPVIDRNKGVPGRELSVLMRREVRGPDGLIYEEDGGAHDHVAEERLRAEGDLPLELLVLPSRQS